ncbi:MAG: GC-type dockerin domain-anchored protein [Planctomycetota bacterium]
MTPTPRPTRTFLAAVIGLACIVVGAADAQSLSWRITPPSFFSNTQSGGTTGVVFRVTEPITVTRLGFYDDVFFSQAGLAQPQQVGIYRDSTQQLLTSGTVVAGPVTPLENFFRMVDVPQVTLQAGIDYVLASTLINDGFIISNQNDELDVDPRIVLVEERAGPGSVLSYPPTFTGTINYDIGPVFEFAEASLAPAPAWDVPSPNNAGGGNANVFGTRFSPNEDITVAALGFYDSTLFGNPEGLAAAHEVGIYDDSNFQLLTSVTVPAGTSAERTGSHRYVDIPPLDLVAGRSYTIAATMAGDPSTNTTPGSSLAVDPRISTSAWVAASGASSLTYPFSLVTTSTRVMGPGFLIAAPDDEPCLPDANGDGLVTPQDFTSWVLAYNTQAPACDQNGDGLCTPQDFTSWVRNFNSGC